MSKTYTQIRSENPVHTPMTGDEIFVVIQDGESRGAIVSELPTSPGGTTQVGRSTVDVSGGNIELDATGLFVVKFHNGDGVASPKTISYSNHSNVQQFDLVLLMASGASLEFPGGTSIDDDFHFNSDTNTWTFDPENDVTRYYIFRFVGDSTTGFFGQVYEGAAP